MNERVYIHEYRIILINAMWDSILFHSACLWQRREVTCPAIGSRHLNEDTIRPIDGKTKICQALQGENDSLIKNERKKRGGTVRTHLLLEPHWDRRWTEDTPVAWPEEAEFFHSKRGWHVGINKCRWRDDHLVGKERGRHRWRWRADPTGHADLATEVR